MSIKLSVTDFSCIKSADLALAPLTILIGPQASGKSVISKLVHFFYGLLLDQFQSIEDLQSVEEFKGQVKQRFKEWFPVDAWGNTKFCIEFSAGDYQVRLTRVQYNESLGENMRVWFSPFFEKQYKDALSTFSAVVQKRGEASDIEFDAFWKIRETGIAVLRQHLKEDFLEVQTFIPAARSFFTSVGKTIVAFEQGRVLDPLTMRFGRLFANVRERSASPAISLMRRKVPWLDPISSVMGGEIVIQRDREYLKTEDGRKIPLSAMSSGQQELMPLIMMIRARSASFRRQRQLITIEEPEAHLFPAAQSALVETFTAMLAASSGSASLLITTHSPYVLAKINNVVKAHQVAHGKSEPEQKRVARIVPVRSWLNPKRLAAYALHDGYLAAINDNDEKLIDAVYLDEVSGAIAREFNELLAIEVGA